MNKESGQVWYSNPPTVIMPKRWRREQETTLGAQLIINYFDPLITGRLGITTTTVLPLTSLRSHRWRVVRVDYLIGEEVEQQSILPVVIGEEKFEELFDQMDAMDQWLIADYYELVTVAESKRGRNEKGVIAGYEVTYPDEEMDVDDQEILGEILVEHFIKYKIGVKEKPRLKVAIWNRWSAPDSICSNREIDMLAWDIEDMIAIFGRLEI